MYRGKNVVTIGQQCVGELISFSHITGYTKDYERDTDIPTISIISINCQVQDLSKSEREKLAGQYDVNKMLKIRLPKDSTIAIEDYFERNNNQYTVVQFGDNLNDRVVYCEYDQRI